MARKPRIAVVGSLNMDLVISLQRMPRMGESLQGDDIHYISGGKGANQAVGCAKLGAEVSMIGAVGDDGFGAQIMKRMNDFGVGTDTIAVLEAPTGTAAILHTEGDNCIVVVPGANGLCSPESIQSHAGVIAGADALIVQLEIPLPAVEAALRTAREAGVRTIINPAPAVRLSEEQIRLGDCFTPNETEFEFYCGSPAASEEQLFAQMRSWRDRFPQQTLIVTRGKRGISCLDGDEIVTVPAPIVEVVDTTGAGDSFNAALCFGLASGWSLERTLPLAVKAASHSVTVFGAQDGMPLMSDLA
ncbi:ribokinase [Paenibacillus sacheonensis]|uniref:Ribokinase n=1 Tax=Paenibacillus sacheonensis TaxID=742054 RepID=A0A7X4YRA1_9BACL|nr:ribokinase [Paenibacillus sacheonensis]MBM7563626.1 ribokinase [Paenibacillus sacheonensis]NBC71078.1 ribokinase [Paenibacillus sacheonensis]